MTAHGNQPGGWSAWPASLRAVIIGLAVGLVPANLWPPLLASLGVPLAATVEVVLLGLFVWWARGGGPPEGTRAARGLAFRRGRLSPAQCSWGLVAAISFAAAVHAAIVSLFRFVPFPIEAFRHGFSLPFISSPTLQWTALVVSATSAGICEETGFRGYMQQPIEGRHGAPTAILVSSFFFTLVHLTKSWALVGMVPIVFGAGALLGLLAWSSGSLIPGIVGHVVMDIGLFAYWWTGLAGSFTARPIAETGVDGPFLAAMAIFLTAVSLVLLAASRLGQIRASTQPPRRPDACLGRIR